MDLMKIAKKRIFLIKLSKTNNAIWKDNGSLLLINFNVSDEHWTRLDQFFDMSNEKLTIGHLRQEHNLNFVYHR